VVRPVLAKYLNRSFILRDCLQSFDQIYGSPFSELNDRHQQLIQLGNQTRKVLIKNILGTELEFIFKEQTPWREINGINLANEILPSEISNYTPTVNGKVVFTGSIISLLPLAQVHGYIKQHPIIFNIENGFIQSLSCENKKLENDLLKIYDYCKGNSEIVELGIGTNVNIKLLGIGAPFEERKSGFHLGTGGYQAQSQHIDYVFDSSEIYFDDVCVFKNNEFLTTQ
jgi:leucyl aminopeptidase (aminopeptidase T)